jgi:hypothetical protein
VCVHYRDCIVSMGTVLCVYTIGTALWSVSMSTVHYRDCIVSMGTVLCVHITQQIYVTGKRYNFKF